MTHTKRVSITLLLIVSLSFGSVFAAANSSAPAQTKTNVQTAKAAPSPIIKKGNYLYYKQSNGKIRTSAGFVSYNGSKYYVSKGGRIITGRTFRVGKYNYRSYSNGRIITGIYKWGKEGRLYYSDPKTGRWVQIKSHRCQTGVKWKGNWYYLQTNSSVAVNRPVVINNLPYYANAKGICTPIGINKTYNSVVKVARQQIGKRTKAQVKGFWTWFFGTRFVDTDVPPWCGTFVGWCYKKAGLYKRIRGIGNIGYVPRYSSYARRNGKWVRKTNARPGDIIVFGRDRHVGIVERVYKGYIYTIEGNSGPDAEVGTRKPGAVTRRIYKLTDSDIKGVLRP